MDEWNLSQKLIARRGWGVVCENNNDIISLLLQDMQKY